MEYSAAEPPWLDEEQQRIWRAYLLGSARLLEKLDADLRQFGLDLPEYEILVTLSEADDERIRMSDLATAVHQSRSRLTHTIGRMERSNLVQRVTCPTDKRGVWAELTEDGRSLLHAAAPRHVLAVRANFVDAVDSGDFAAIGRAFTTMVELDSSSA